MYCHCKAFYFTFLLFNIVFLFPDPLKMKWKCDHLYKPKPLFWKIQLLSLARLSHLINTLLHMLLTTAQLNSVHFSMLFSWLITGNTETKWMDTKTWEVLYFFPYFSTQKHVHTELSDEMKTFTKWMIEVSFQQLVSRCFDFVNTVMLDEFWRSVEF